MKMTDKLKEECAVFGVSSICRNAAAVTVIGLTALQHRGQEGCGIALSDGRRLYLHKNTGLVQEVFTEEIYNSFSECSAAVGHNRYSTTGVNCRENLGPFVFEYLTGRIAVSHNGNVTNADTLKKRLEIEGISFQATSDSEVLSALIAYSILKEGEIKSGIIKAVRQLEGAFSLVVMTGDGSLYVIRDGSGYRPLCMGIREEAVAVASESCALESCGFEFLRDVYPGELVVLNGGKIKESEIILTNKSENSGICIFEYVYFARPDSVLDGQSVYEARRKMGQQLAAESPAAADIVIGVPDSGLDAAFGYSEASQIPYACGFVKNRYIGRSFICPTQEERIQAVRLKLNPLTAVVKGKRIVLIDDSIVRGTTSKKIIENLRRAGALEIHVRISSPQFRYGCNYGTDIDGEEHLLANQMSTEEIRDAIGADSLEFISVEGLKTACGDCTLSFCTHCFTGNQNSRSCKKDRLEVKQ